MLQEELPMANAKSMWSTKYEVGAIDNSVLQVENAVPEFYHLSLSK
jgi:hypothetical protein